MPFVKKGNRRGFNFRRNDQLSENDNSEKDSDQITTPEQSEFLTLREDDTANELLPEYTEESESSSVDPLLLMDTTMPNNSQNNRGIIPLKMEVVEDEKIKLSNEVNSFFIQTEDNRTPRKSFGFSARESVSDGKNKYGHNYCRLCLISINRNVREQIFGKEPDIGLSNKIEKCFDFTLKENDGFSLYICASCKKLLIQFYKFRVMCQYYEFKLLRTKQRAQNEKDQQYSHDYCRLCLVSFQTLNQQYDQHSKREKIFNNLNNCGLSRKIKNSVNVDVQENDGYSTFICLNCKNQIIKYNTFKLKCQHSDYTLKQAEQPTFTAGDSVQNPNVASDTFKKASVENFVLLTDNKIYRINDHKKIKDSTQMATNKAYDQASETNDAKDTSNLLVIDLQSTEAATFQYVETEETVDKKVKPKRETPLPKHYMQEIEARNGLQLKKVEHLNNVKILNIKDRTRIIGRKIKAKFLDTQNSSKFEVTDQAIGGTNKDDTSFLEIDLQVTKDSFVKRVYQNRKTLLSKDVITQENTLPDAKKPILNDITLTGIDSKEIKVKKLDKNITTDLKEMTDTQTKINEDVSLFSAIYFPLRAKETNAKRIYQNRKILLSKHGSLENKAKQPICTTVNAYQDPVISNKIVGEVNMEEVIRLNEAERQLLNEEINRVKTKACRKVRAKIVKTPKEKMTKRRTQANEDSNTLKKVKKRKKLKNQVCHICGLKVHSIAEHLIVHDIGKNGAFKCTTCGKSYSRKSVCKIHMKRHLSVNPYHCLICDMKFPSKDSLKRHLKVHSGEREHQCHLCPKRFQNGYNLRTHIRSHTGERPYKCPHCELTFVHRATLNPHVKKCTADAENGNSNVT